MKTKVSFFRNYLSKLIIFVRLLKIHWNLITNNILALINNEKANPNIIFAPGNHVCPKCKRHQFGNSKNT